MFLVTWNNLFLFSETDVDYGKMVYFSSDNAQLFNSVQQAEEYVRGVFDSGTKALLSQIEYANRMDMFASRIRERDSRDQSEHDSSINENIIIRSINDSPSSPRVIRLKVAAIWETTSIKSWDDPQ